MTTRPAHPLRRAAPLRLLASPGWFLLVTVAVALLTAAVAAPVLFLRAASDAAMKGELAAVEQDAFASTSSGVRGAWSGVLKPPEQQTVLRALRRLPGFTPPQVQAVGIKAGTTPGTRGMVGSRGRSAASALYYRDGAVEALDPDGTAPPGVWLDRDVAAELGVESGDTVRLWIEITQALGEPAVGKATVAGVFTRSPGSALPAAVAENQQVAKADLPWDPDRPASGTPIVVADQATFSRLVGQIRDIALWTADLDLERGLTAQQTVTASEGVQHLAVRAFDDTTRLAAATLTAKPLPDHLQVNSGLPDIVDRFLTTAEAAEDQSSAFVSAGIALGVVVVCAAGVLLGRSRRRELDLMTGLGMSPGEAGRLALAESLLPVAVGTVAGGVIAWVCVGAVGPPGRLEDGAVGETVRRAVGAGVAALVLLGLCAAATAWLVERRATGGMYAERRRVPWEPVLIVAAGLCGFSVVNTGTGARPSSPLSVVFPVLLSAVVAVVVLWLLRLVASRGRGRAGTGSPRWLAVQRSRAGARETVAVALAVAVGLSVLGYALAVHRGVTQGMDDKVAAAVGARTVVNVEDQLKRKVTLATQTRDGRPKLPYPPIPASTVVWRQTVKLPPSFGDQPLLAVDRRTFASVADWGSTGELGDGRKALDLLDTKLKNKFAVPVVIAGRTDKKVGDRGVLNSWDEWVVPYEVVAVVEAFPGSESEPNDVTVYVGARQLFDEIPGLEPMVLQDPPSNGAGEFSAEIWSSRDSTNVADFLVARGLEARDTRLREHAQASSTLVAAGWSAGYVVALGTGAVLLVGAAALLLAVRLADRDRVSDILLRRMGYSPRDLTAARTWEVAAVVASALLAAVVAVGALTVAPSMIEPDVSLLPRISPLPGLIDLGLLLLVTAAMVLAAAAVARRRVSRAVPAEVLRGNG